MGESATADVFPLLEPPDQCPACGAGRQLRPLHVAPNTKPMMPARFLAWIGCQRCGLVFVHPRPTPEQVDAFYSEPGGWRADKNWKPDRDYRESEKYRRYSAAWELLAPYLATSPGKALDFGCGSGAWLDVLKDAGWETWGIEPGAAREMAARRHRMLDSIPTHQAFDLVIINHVLEHVGEPLAVLQQIAEATALGGKLYVSVPDLSRVGEHGRLGSMASGVHICSYTASAMSSVLGLVGFRIVAHFDTEEWDSLGTPERARLKMLAENTGEPTPPSGNPLQEAITSLVEYTKHFEGLQAEDRAKREAKRAYKRAMRSTNPQTGDIDHE